MNRYRRLSIALLGPLLLSITLTNLGTVWADNLTFSASPSSLTVPLGTSASSTITITGSPGPGGTCVVGSTGVYTVLYTQISPNVTNGPTVTLSSNCILLDSSGKATTVLTVTPSSTTPLGAYTVAISSVTGCWGSLMCADYFSGSIQVPVNVTNSGPGSGITISDVSFFMGTRTTVQGTLSLGGNILSGSIAVTTTNTTDGSLLFSGTFQVSVLVPSGGTARFVLKESTASQILGTLCSVNANSSAQNCFVARNPAVDGANTVDLMSVSMVFRDYGTTSGTSQYNPAVDLDGSGAVDIIDCGIIAADYGAPVFS